ncbi:unnamed protein product [Nesidiocoris tenuis]|uniref:Uncharacterized protein n=1 Tax=Nesidiocoris tenuis TaxID=355587 RepID=A0A6H5FYD9_9HEMI|nr:unnamed protein product [Nesidiocoris tenuis]
MNDKPALMRVQDCMTTAVVPTWRMFHFNNLKEFEVRRDNGMTSSSFHRRLSGLSRSLRDRLLLKSKKFRPSQLTSESPAPSVDMTIHSRLLTQSAGGVDQSDRDNAAEGTTVLTPPNSIFGENELDTPLDRFFNSRYHGKTAKEIEPTSEEEDVEETAPLNVFPC